jgi:peptidoglycan-associated lipoprotein
MQVRQIRRVVLVSLLSLAVLGAGCKKTPVVVQPPPPPLPVAPTPPRPTVTLQAAPATVQRGQAITLTWSSSNATTLNLVPGVGNVAPQGSTSVSPADSTTYTITATGPGGTADATTRVTVTVPPPPPPPPAPQPSLDELFTRAVRDALFDLDKADIRPDARDALSQTAQFLRSNPQVRVTIEGHCDERGSTEYNLALGDRRAQAAKDYLVSLGVTADRMQTVSYGKERPACLDHAEACWQQNRRAHMVRGQ